MEQILSSDQIALGPQPQISAPLGPQPQESAPLGPQPLPSVSPSAPAPTVPAPVMPPPVTGGVVPSDAADVGPVYVPYAPSLDPRPMPRAGGLASVPMAVWLVGAAGLAWVLFFRRR